MKIQIHNTSNNPANTTMVVYAGNNPRPLMTIDEDDLSECLTNAQAVKFDDGKYEFNVSSSQIDDMMMRSKQYHPLNK